MPVYANLTKLQSDTRKRTVNSLQNLRKHLHTNIPRRTLKDTLLLATWNLRDFGGNRKGHGSRQTESLYYISEIIASFDIVALQEIGNDLRALEKVMSLFG